MGLKNQKGFNQTLLSEWQRLIRMKEDDIKFYKKEKNVFMYELTKKVLTEMKNEYEKITKKFKAS
jgi:CRISPR/Cas system-associated endoribonuclease Cas2